MQPTKTSNLNRVYERLAFMWGHLPFLISTEPAVQPVGRLKPELSSPGDRVEPAIKQARSRLRG
jgi:hypothetical protein